MTEAVVVIGAGGGIGQALVEFALRRMICGRQLPRLSSQASKPWPSSHDSKQVPFQGATTLDHTPTASMLQTMSAY